jgi:hypothetical protein
MSTAYESMIPEMFDIIGSKSMMTLCQGKEDDEPEAHQIILIWFIFVECKRKAK